MLWLSSRIKSFKVFAFKYAFEQQWASHFLSVKINSRSFNLQRPPLLPIKAFVRNDSVWPDLAKNCHFGEIFKVIGQFLVWFTWYLPIICTNFGNLLYYVGKFSLLKSNLAIWSHCSWLKYIYFAVQRMHLMIYWNKIKH